ncbi:MAG: IS3 family transposase, partial [Roseburia sp.]|nr:IS3 family transposase [Roseburia sp.]
MLCEGNRLEAYRFLDQHQKEFGIRWLLKRLGICPNAYYNYRKHRKADYYAQKTEVQEQIRDIYYSHNGVDGSRSMAAYLERRGYRYSRTTVHKYMNKELGLHSIVRPRKPGTKPGKPHKVFENKLKQNFTAE